MQPRTFLRKQLVRVRKCRLPIFASHDLDRITIPAAAKGAEIADIDTRTLNLIDRISRNVASFPACQGVGYNSGIAVAVGRTGRHEYWRCQLRRSPV